MPVSGCHGGFRHQRAVTLAAATLLLVACRATEVTPRPSASNEISFTPPPRSPPARSSEAAKPTTGPKTPWVRLTVVVDTLDGPAALQRSWGLAVVVEDPDDRVLFDTGPDGAKLLHNLDHLGFDPLAIDSVVLSHVHHDHVGGIDALLQTGGRPSVFVLPSFPAHLRTRVRAATAEVVARRGSVVGTALLSTGELPGPPGEQALLVNTKSGTVVVTGCAHPGVVPIVERARELTGPRIRLVLGGFHLGTASDAAIDNVVSGLRRLGVAQIAPCHCTGARATQRLRTAYGLGYREVHLGEPLLVADGDSVSVDEPGSR